MEYKKFEFDTEQEAIDFLANLTAAQGVVFEIGETQTWGVDAVGDFKGVDLTNEVTPPAASSKNWISGMEHLYTH